MTKALKYTIPINTLLPHKPGIIIWYSRMEEILLAVLGHANYHDAKPQAGTVFKKNDFLIPFFSQEEIDTLNGFKALKKQVEWISGRCLVKQMVHDFFMPNVPFETITISYLNKGAPFVANAPHIPISLSHSNDYAATACSKIRHKSIGIDIEKITTKPDIHFLKTAFTKNEIAHMQDDAGFIFKNWTIKEAYLKYIKKGFNESLHKVEIINDEVLHDNKKTDVDICSFSIEGYVLSLISD